MKAAKGAPPVRTPALTKELVRAWLKPRPSASHKGDFGHVLIVAGSRGMTGAAVLAAEACMRAGAGLVTLGTPESQQPVVAAHLKEAMTLPLMETAEGCLSPAALQRLRLFLQDRGIGRVALGPGLSVQPRTVEAVLDLVETVDLPLVIDADALNALSSLDRKGLEKHFRRRKAASILTPHPGEMARLMKTDTAAVQRDRRSAAEELASELRAVVVLKGEGTVVTDGRTTYVNPTGNPGLAKGGTGDVLTGFIAGLWGQRSGALPGALEAAALGVYLHGLSADLAAETTPPLCLMPTDVLRFFPKAVGACLKA